MTEKALAGRPAHSGKYFLDSMYRTMAKKARTNRRKTTPIVENASTSPDVLGKFKQLFWEARKEHARLGLDANDQSPAHRDAVEYARTHAIPGAERLLTASLLSRTEQEQDGLECLDKSVPDLPTELSGHQLFVRSHLALGLKRLHESIECCQTILALPESDRPDYVLGTLGLAYLKTDELDQAIESFQKALSFPSFDGISSTFAWHNLGCAYARKGEFDLAINSFQKAIAASDMAHPHKALNNLASALREVGRFDEALQQVERVLSEPDDEGEHERAKLLLSLILSEKDKINPSADDKALVAAVSQNASNEETPEIRMTRALQGKETKYEEYLKREPSGRNDTFSILRGWSSAVTLLEGGTECQWRGGGYFLKWGGCGVVIDPGFDFLDNFHDAHFHGREIDAVLVSHNHPDHNYDLGSLDDLRYEIFRRKAQDPHQNKVVRGELRPLTPYLLAIDEDTVTGFPDNSPDHRGTPVRFARYAHERKHWLVKENGLPLTVEHFPVDHGKDVPHAVGMRLRLHRESERDFVLGYTGDTKYFEGLADQLRECDILLAHVSQPKPQEFVDPNFERDIHLGYNGVTRLIREVKPRLALIGEFWAGLEDLRLDLVAGVRKQSGHDAVFPACLGLHLRLPSCDVECTNCHRAVPFATIRIAPASVPFGPLGYLCQSCVL